MLLYHIRDKLVGMFDTYVHLCGIVCKDEIRDHIFDLLFLFAPSLFNDLYLFGGVQFYCGSDLVYGLLILVDLHHLRDTHAIDKKVVFGIFQNLIFDLFCSFRTCDQSIGIVHHLILKDIVKFIFRQLCMLCQKGRQKGTYPGMLTGGNRFFKLHPPVLRYDI